MCCIHKLCFVLFKGYIIQKSEKKPSLTPDKPTEELLTYVWFAMNNYLITD